jgi:hypothetical protein
MLEFLLALAELLNGMGALGWIVDDPRSELCMRGLCAERDDDSESCNKHLM